MGVMRTIAMLAALAFGSLQDPAALISSVSPGSKYLTAVTGVSARSIKAGSRTSVFLDVTPKPRIHVYAPGATGYIPISLAITPPAGVKVGTVAYPKPEIYFFAELNERVPVYQKPFRLTVDVTPDPSRHGPMTLSGTLKYQACDDKVCYAPITMPVAWSITVE
jgi:DsbC/DsbD-like thiol-disulfide interchange protein